MEKENNFSVYCHTNKVNGYKYVGLSIDPNRRWRNNGKEYKGSYFYYFIKKYGWDNFKHEILESGLTLDEAKEKEIYYIKKFNTCIHFPNSKGYNVTEGGDDSMYGGKNPMARQVIYDGKIFGSVLECAKYIGCYPNMINHWLNGESPISKSLVEKGLRYADEEPNYVIKKNEKMNGGKTKRVYCDGVIYNTTLECANHYNIKKDTMTKWLNGTNGMPMKFYNLGLKYYDEENETKSHNEKLQGVSTKCYLLKDDIIFNSLTECVNYLKNNYDKSIKQNASTLSGAISKGNLFHGFKIMPIEEYNSYSKEELDELRKTPYVKPNSVKVVCVDEKKLFLRMQDACAYYGGASSNLTEALNKGYKYRGHRMCRLSEYDGDENELSLISVKHKNKKGGEK